MIGLTGGVWESVYVGNDLGAWMTALMVFVVIYVLLWFIQAVVIAYLHTLAKKTATDIDDAFIRMVQAIKPSLYFLIALWFGLAVLELPLFLTDAVGYVLLIWTVYQGIRVAQVVIEYVMRRSMQRVGGEDEMPLRVIATLTKIALWIFGVIFILQNFGIEVTSLIAGLGIGGIAIGLAVQNILADLFSSFAIYFDKPFVVGDVIQVGQHMGTVEKIGIKTTRIRSPQGEEIVMSNAELTGARIQNFKRLEERRALLHFGVLYETDREVLKKIPSMVEEVINEIDSVRFDRAHFTTFDDSALTFEVAYYVGSAEYKDFMDAQQAVNFGVHDRFQKEKIGMAYPTRTVYVKK